MDKAVLREQIRKIIAEEAEVSVEEVKDELLTEDLGIDSLSMSSVLANLEDLDIEVDSEKVFDSSDNYTIGALIKKIVDSIIEWWE